MTRLEKIKKRLFEVEFYTKKEWWGEGLTILDDPALRDEPLIIRKALACEFVLLNMPAELKPDELITGIARMSMIGFGHTFPQYAYPEEIEAAAKDNLSPLSIWGHQPPNYEKVLKIGLAGIRKQIQEQIDREQTKAAPDKEKLTLYRAMIISLNAIRSFALRYHDMCHKAAEMEKSEDRRAELLAVADRCLRVPEEPADSFAEALQCVWFIYLCLQSNMENIPLGRVDQYLYPYYKKDIDSGKLGDQAAEELVGSFLAKFNERVQMNPEHWESHNHVTTYSFGCNPDDQSLFVNLENDESYNFGVSANHWDLNLILGGVRPDGIDGTNELTYLFLKVWGYLEVITPVIAVRFSKNSPQKLYEACADILRYGSGEPVIYNEEPIIDGYVKLGIPVEDARDFTNDGCWETLIPGKSHYSYTHIEVLQLLEYVFQRGYSLVRKHNEGLDLGDLARFKNFEDFYQAFKTQLYHQLDTAIANRIMYYGASYKIAPDPMISAMIDGCIEKGKDLTAGGAQYTIYSPFLTGLSDCIDSLAAVKKIVYEDETVSLEELAKAQRENFKDQEPLRQMMINRAPKFGNDDEYVDGLLVRLIKDFESRVEEISGNYPDIYMPLGIATFENFNKFGHKIGASASGRRFQEAVGSNFSPSFGADKEGPTAAVKSSVAADLKRFVTGCPLDMQVNSNETSGPEGLQRLCGFIKSFIQLGGLILTITGVNSEILMEAQKNPDKYRTLRVRMGGLSAYFIALPKVMQDTLIRKTKHRI